MLELIESFANLILWVMLLVSILKYKLFDVLPMWLQIVLFSAMGASGVAGILQNWF